MIADFINYIPDTTIEEVDESSSDGMDLEYTAKEYGEVIMLADAFTTTIDYGPYTVIRRNQGGSYELKDEMNEILHCNYVPSEVKVVNIDKKVIDHEYFEIEAIRDHRGKAANREYLIKWKGYGERMCSWITAEDVSDSHILQRYWQKHMQLQKQEEGRIRERVAQMPSKQQRKRAAIGEADQAGAPQSPAKRRRATYVREKTG
ncbi:uncharacterized protein ATC70_000073 [Mucor velutinosus]|uniref:Chromo domain-containing protein n=1 Tax=Mucor velutinosus TaxID=708070 RepID=A0AAN7HKF6_9FUNG|nr:hypothetical protein ATC70_000073 [Mucor velutinosus]